MKLEEQVCTLEQAKRLQDLGVKDPSLFKWIDFSFDGNGTEFRPVFSPIDFKKCYPAYTVAELGEILPQSVGNEWNSINIIGTHKMGNRFNCYWEYHHNELHPTEAQARAAMLIYLLENAILSPPKTQVDAQHTTT